MITLFCSLNGHRGDLHAAPLIRAARVRMLGDLFHRGGAACLLVTSHAGSDPVAQVLFSLS